MKRFFSLLTAARRVLTRTTTKSKDRQVLHYLTRESERQGRKVTQREFVLGLIEDALRQAEQEATDAAPDAPDDIPAPAEDQEADAEMESEDEETAEGCTEDVAE